MGNWLRVLAVFLIAAPFSAMFAEPFFAAILDQLGVDTEDWAAPVVAIMFELFASEWFRYLSFTAIGIGVGIWTHWAATKFDRRNIPASSKMIASPQKLRMSWQDALRAREDICPYEAAALIADVPPSEGGDTSEMFENEIIDAIVYGKIRSQFTDPNDNSPGEKLFLRTPAFEARTQELRRNALEDGAPVKKVDIAEFYFRKGMFFAVKALGHDSNQFEGEKRQSPQDIAEKTQR